MVKLNTDDNQHTAAKYGIMSIPTMIVFKNGEPAGQIVGAMPKPPRTPPQCSSSS